MGSIDTSEKVANGINGTNGKVNNWQTPGPAAFDFRSDTITTPTASMLEAIIHTTLMDDVYREDSTTNSLQSHIASLTGHEDALLMMSGTMGNQVALRSHLMQPPHAVLCDYRGHILEWEAGGVATLSAALVKGVVPSNGKYLTLEDIKRSVVISDDIHSCPTRVISLENTLGGVIMPLEETRRISEFARANGIKMHLDGARLWEVVAAGAGSLTDFAQCFDSVQLCFSKGLCAPIGSILVGSKSFIKHACWIRKSIGGGIRQAGIISAAARVAVDEGFGNGPNGEGGHLVESHKKAKRIAATWVAKGGKLGKPTETNMVWFDLAAADVTVHQFIGIAKRWGIKVMGGRLVVHRQISEEAISLLEKVMDDVLSDDPAIKAANSVPEGEKIVAPCVEYNLY
ncbi:MAG: hypothetical protein M1834_005181 [Cirrosporium novae-zelandiae]|nr:MAG: hypothetical protein M1834_005181 [Cirrosporium novae-zelandiae]